jgi:hypothetical protein
MILCDTNILMEFYKNNPKIVDELRQIGLERLAINYYPSRIILWCDQQSRITQNSKTFKPSPKFSRKQSSFYTIHSINGALFSKS